MAHSYYNLGNYDLALEYYSDYSGDSKLHEAAAYAGRAACYEQKEDYLKAAENYKRAADINELDSQKAEYLLNAGINYIKAGNKDDARDVLELVKVDYKTTTAATEVDKFLMQL